jgi:membrane-associated phospholipid phosphatase
MRISVAHQPSARFVWPTPREWLLFAVQALLVVMIELGNDILRGNFFPPNAPEALSHARQIAHFEAAHGFFLEPAVQTFFERSHHLLGLVLTWSAVVAVANNVYAFCHIFVTLAVALWLYLEHRPSFAFVRNVTLFTNLLALLGYELYPTAPPRLTTDLIYDGHVFHFQDTMRHILGTGTLNGTPIGYNPLSAMPSLHVAWALIMGASLLLLARHPLLRFLGALYPLLMTFTVVVTANHYLMDAIGAALAVILATLLALLLSRARRTLRAERRGADPIRSDPSAPRAA